MWNGLFLNSIWHEVFKICYSTFVEQGLWGLNYLGNHWWRVTSFHQINVFVDTTHFCLMVTKKAAGLVFEKNDPYYYNVTCISTNNKDCGVGNFLYSKCSCCIMESFCLQHFNCLVSTHDYVTLISFYSQRFCHGVRLLEKVVLQDNLSTLVVNLYPRSEGYSLMLKGKTSIPSALSVKGQRFIAFNGQQIFSKDIPI